jgi:iron complex outermembrane receptor protein
VTSMARPLARHAMRLISAACAVLLSAATISAFAAGTVVSGTVSGSDQGFLTGASVIVDDGARKTTTDADGRFSFGDVPKGRHRLQVTAEGYLALDRPLDVGDASVSIDVMLLRLPRAR